MVVFFKWLFLLLLTLLLVVFIVVNRHSVAISLFPLPYEVQLPAYLFVLIFFLCGFFMSWLFMSTRRTTSSLALKQCKKRIEALENELRGLRLGRAISHSTS